MSVPDVDRTGRPGVCRVAGVSTDRTLAQIRSAIHPERARVSAADVRPSYRLLLARSPARQRPRPGVRRTTALVLGSTGASDEAPATRRLSALRSLTGHVCAPRLVGRAQVSGIPAVSRVTRSRTLPPTLSMRGCELPSSAQHPRSAPQARSGGPAFLLSRFWRQMRRSSSPGDVWSPSPSRGAASIHTERRCRAPTSSLRNRSRESPKSAKEP